MISHIEDPYVSLSKNIHAFVLKNAPKRLGKDGLKKNSYKRRSQYFILTNSLLLSLQKFSKNVEKFTLDVERNPGGISNVEFRQYREQVRKTVRTYKNIRRDIVDRMNANLRDIESFSIKTRPSLQFIYEKELGYRTPQFSMTNTQLSRVDRLIHGVDRLLGEMNLANLANLKKKRIKKNQNNEFRRQVPSVPTYDPELNRLLRESKLGRYGPSWRR